MVSLLINNIYIQGQVDTGLGLTVISKSTFLRDFAKSVKLYDYNGKISGYTGKNIVPIGYFYACVTKKNNRCDNFKIVVIRNGGPMLLGRDFLERFDKG